MISAVSFPALQFDLHTIIVSKSRGDLERVTPHAVRSGYYDHVTIVDSQLARFSVLNYKVAKGFLNQAGRVLGMVTKYNVGLSSGEIIGMSSLKKDLLVVMNRHPHMWDGLGDIDLYRGKIDSAKDISQLFSVFDWPR